MAQWAKQSAAAAAVQQMSQRFASGGDALAALVRERQDLSAFRRDRDKALLAAIAKPQGQQNSAVVGTLRRKPAEIDSKLAANTARLEREFPEYAAFASGKPLKAGGGRSNCSVPRRRCSFGSPGRGRVTFSR